MLWVEVELALEGLEEEIHYNNSKSKAYLLEELEMLDTHFDCLLLKLLGGGGGGGWNLQRGKIQSVRGQ